MYGACQGATQCFSPLGVVEVEVDLSTSEKRSAKFVVRGRRRSAKEHNTLRCSAIELEIQIRSTMTSKKIASYGYVPLEFFLYSS